VFHFDGQREEFFAPLSFSVPLHDTIHTGGNKFVLFLDFFEEGEPPSEVVRDILKYITHHF
jgi:hypothetical protein